MNRKDKNVKYFSEHTMTCLNNFEFLQNGSFELNKDKL